MSQGWCTVLPTGQGVRLAVQITPNGKKNAVIGVLDAVLKVKIQAPPVDGKANEALIQFLADRLALPRRAVCITHGHLSKHKLIEIASPGLTVEVVRRDLLSAI